jgi:hypothetical protein
MLRGEIQLAHSARRPPIGLLYLPRVIMRMENLVEIWLAGETEVLGENYSSATLSTTNPTLRDRVRTRAVVVESQRLVA